MPRTATTVATHKIFLRVPYKQKAKAQALGAGFEFYKPGQKPPDGPPGYAYIKPGALIAPFAQWRRLKNPFAPDPSELPWTAPGEKNAAAVALGSLGGRAGGHKGGKARAANLTPEQLSAIGRLGAKTRWENEMKRRETARQSKDDTADFRAKVEVATEYEVAPPVVRPKGRSIRF
jgi:hypothetical protein